MQQGDEQPELGRGQDPDRRMFEQMSGGQPRRLDRGPGHLEDQKLQGIEHALVLAGAGGEPHPSKQTAPLQALWKHHIGDQSLDPVERHPHHRGERDRPQTLEKVGFQPQPPQGERGKEQQGAEGRIYPGGQKEGPGRGHRPCPGWVPAAPPFPQEGHPQQQVIAASRPIRGRLSPREVGILKPGFHLQSPCRRKEKRPSC